MVTHMDYTDTMHEYVIGELKKMVPANRFGEATEVAHLVSFLASEKSSYITGEIININGGIYSKVHRYGQIKNFLESTIHVGR